MKRLGKETVASYVIDAEAWEGSGLWLMIGHGSSADWDVMRGRREGVHVAADGLFLKRGLTREAARALIVELDAGVSPPAPAVEHKLKDCDRELRASPGYDVFRCKPAVFVCSCGRRFECDDSEAEGVSWVLADG